MPTNWSAFGLQDSNLQSMEILTPYQVSLILSEFPGIPTQVTLDARPREVRLYSPDASVRYAIDGVPLEPLSVQGMLVDFGSFRLGDSLLPGTWQGIAIPDDSLVHQLFLTSPGAFANVLLVALLEG